MPMYMKVALIWHHIYFELGPLFGITNFFIYGNVEDNIRTGERFRRFGIH